MHLGTLSQQATLFPLRFWDLGLEGMLRMEVRCQRSDKGMSTVQDWGGGGGKIVGSSLADHLSSRGNPLDFIHLGNADPRFPTKGRKTFV